MFLPQTGFPMRGDLPKKEPQILARWDAHGPVAQAARRIAQGRPLFILHDGPPYANGDIHIGTALNKILKDFVVRTRQMAGYDADYMPGWDCHGLPIEWKIEEEYRAAEARTRTRSRCCDFRAECRAYAAHWMAVQAAGVPAPGRRGRLGAIATPPWIVRPRRRSPREICKFLLNGALYRGLRPVMWSPVEKTALAEAEIEYHDHTSPTIWVRFPVITGARPELHGASVVIWTTTPWTMPGNRAIAAGRTSTTRWSRSMAVGGRLAARASAKSCWSRWPCCRSSARTPASPRTTSLHVLQGCRRSPAWSARIRWRGPAATFRTCRCWPATSSPPRPAPASSTSRPATARRTSTSAARHGLEIPETVGDDGTFNPACRCSPACTSTRPPIRSAPRWTRPAALLARGRLVHSYPHSWRSKAPVIFRATPQWFIRLDGPEQIREKALAAIDATQFVPDAGRNRIGSMVDGRPDW